MKPFGLNYFINYRILFLIYAMSAMLLFASCASNPITIPNRSSIEISTFQIPVGSETQSDFESKVVTYSLEKAIEQALLNNPRLLALYARFEQLTLQTPQVTSLPDPKISYSQFVEGVQTRTGEQEFIIGVNQTFPWFGELELQGKIADAKAFQALEEYRIAMLDIREQVSTTIYQLVYQKAALELTIEDKDTLQQALEAVTSLYITGQRGRDALLKTQTELALIENELAAFPAKIDALQSELANLMHLDYTIEIEELFTQDNSLLSDVEISSLVEIALQSRPELNITSLDSEIAKLEHNLAEKDDYPDVTIGINYIGIGDSPTNPSDEGDDAWNIGMSFNIPIQNERRKAVKKSAKTRSVEAEYRLQSQMNQIEKELSSILSELHSLQQQQTILQTNIIPLAKETLEASRISYESGRATILDLLDAQRTYIHARGESLKIQRDTLLATTKLERQVGGIVHYPAEEEAQP